MINKKSFRLIVYFLFLLLIGWIVFTHYPNSPLKKITFINARYFGAVPDKGINNTEAIQLALDKASKLNEGVYLPKGTYLVDKLIIKSNTVLYGEQAALKPSKTTDFVLAVDGSDITVNGVMITGYSRALNGITVQSGSSNININNCTVENIAQPTNKEDDLYGGIPVGIRIEGNTNKITIDHCTVRNVVADHIASTWPHKVARGILISPSHPEQSLSHDITIKNSNIEKIAPKDDGDGVTIQGWDSGDANLQIINNTFNECHKRAIKIQSPGALIQGNAIYNPFHNNNYYETYSEPNNYDMYAAISIEKDNVKILNNNIKSGGTYYASIDVSGADNIDIEGNDITNGQNPNDSMLIRMISPLTINNATIKNNTLHSNSGIYIESRIAQADINGNKITPSN